MKRNQSGMTLLGFLLVLVVVGFAAFIAMRLFPMYQEFYAVKSSLKGVAAEPGVTLRAAMRLPGSSAEKTVLQYAHAPHGEPVEP